MAAARRNESPKDAEAEGEVRAPEADAKNDWQIDWICGDCQFSPDPRCEHYDECPFMAHTPFELPEGMQVLVDGKAVELVDNYGDQGSWTVKDAESHEWVYEFVTDFGDQKPWETLARALPNAVEILMADGGRKPAAAEGDDDGIENMTPSLHQGLAGGWMFYNGCIDEIAHVHFEAYRETPVWTWALVNDETGDLEHLIDYNGQAIEEAIRAAADELAGSGSKLFPRQLKTDEQWLDEMRIGDIEAASYGVAAEDSGFTTVCDGCDQPFFNEKMTWLEAAGSWLCPDCLCALPQAEEADEEITLQSLLELGTDELARALWDAYETMRGYEADAERDGQKIEELEGLLETASEEAEMFEGRLGVVEPELERVKASCQALLRKVRQLRHEVRVERELKVAAEELLASRE